MFAQVLLEVDIQTNNFTSKMGRKKGLKAYKMDLKVVEIREGMKKERRNEGTKKEREGRNERTKEGMGERTKEQRKQRRKEGRKGRRKEGKRGRKEGRKKVKMNREATKQASNMK